MIGRCEMRLFKRKQKDIDLTKLESRLAETLRPIAPRQEFIDDLRSRLMAHRSLSTQDIIIQQKQTVPRGLIVAGGVVGSLLMLVVSIRGLLSIAGLISLIVQQRRQLASQPAH